MRGGTVQINWHDTKPVLTLDFHPQSGLLATGGADYDIKLWLITPSEDPKKAPTASYHNSLSYHGSTVNVLRFAPSGGSSGLPMRIRLNVEDTNPCAIDGQLLASGADGGELIIWKLHSTDVGQTWKVLKTLSFHRKDVLDLQWSADGAHLVSGSVDNSCIIWDVTKGSAHQVLDGHLHYVQGVAWDPLGQYIASLSSDRTCRVYVKKPLPKSKGLETVNFVSQHVIVKAEQQQQQNDSKMLSTKTHLFHDETLPSFFRRLAWSPDGSFLLVPAGSYKVSSSSSDYLNTAYIFSRKDLSRPALQLPAASKPIVAVCFCPIVFSLRNSNSGDFFKLPYRFVFAVATLNSLYIYDTESVAPIAILAGLHYAAITDIAWSSNAKYLALSSQDGYCTLIEFEGNELGTPIPISETKKTEEENKNPLHPVLEEIKSADPTATETAAKVDRRTETKGAEEKQASSKPTSTTSTSNKPAKRRITPMAIDNP